MRGEEVPNLPCPFAGQKRADRINQVTAGPDQLCGDFEQALLGFDQAVEALGGKPPSPFRVAAPRAAARAWRIDQYEVGGSAPVVELFQLARRAQQARLDLSAGALGAWSQLRQPPPTAVRGQDPC